MNLLWPWLLKYSSLLMTGAITFVVSYILHRVNTKRSALIFYTSHLQFVPLPNPPLPVPGQAQAIQQAPNMVGTFTLFIYNDGKATAKNVQVGHFVQPFVHSVFPDIPRIDGKTPGGGWLMRLEFIPPKTMVTITYLTNGIFNVDQVLSGCLMGRWCRKAHSGHAAENLAKMVAKDPNGNFLCRCVGNAQSGG